MSISLGLCCLNTELREKKIFNSRSCIRRTFTVEKAKKLAIQNVKDLIPMIEYNEKHNIRCFRISSDMFPHFTDTETESYDIDFAREYLRQAGELINEYGHRVLMHPGQYNQVATKNLKVFDNTIKDLSHHADILDAMDINQDGVLIVHGGGVYGDKPKTIKRWVDRYFLLPEKVQKRLVIENCEKSYSLEDVLIISQKVKERGGHLPVVFDIHHYNCYQILHPEVAQKSLEKLIPRVLETWGDIRPVMHISEQGTGKVGHHSDFIETIPDIFFYTAYNLNTHFDLEIEAKKKEQAIFKLYKLYPEVE